MSGRKGRIVEDALARGADHHRAGRWRNAAAAYADALRADPDNIDALTLLGGVLLRMERAAEAVALLDRAARDAPAHALAQLNRARALLLLDRPHDAVAAFDAALAARPGFPEAARGRARALLAAGRPGEAEAAVRDLLSTRPGDARLHVDLGASLLAQDRPEAADAAWEAAARLAPDLPGLAASRAALARATGLARLAAGAPDAAEWLRRALARDPTDRAALLGLADALYQRTEAATRADLDRLLAADGVDHQRLGHAIEHVLAGLGAFEGDPPSNRVDGEGRSSAKPLLPPGTTPLVLAWLHRTVVASPRGLALVRALRRDALARVHAGTDVSIELLEALAVQAWNTEHADVDAADEALADALVALPPSKHHAAAFALSRPLARYPHPLGAPGLEALATLVRREIVEPAEERALAPSIPSLAAHDDATSDAVRAQYEANPYPRLVGVHRRVPVPFHVLVHGLLPTVDVPARARVRVLVAGGGTGQHPISVAAGIEGAEVVAVDLSRASLGRAARVARAHGVPVRFVQGDLLALGDDGQAEGDGLGAFDFVDCVGVLHHLADPLAGGRALVARLAPGGLLRLGLYSERGRADVVAARALAAEHGWEPTPAGLRAARRALLALPADHPAAGLAASVDLYSQSGLRDLVFHPCEHRYRPAEVAGLVDALGLRVLGLQHARPEAARLYRARWPDDAAQADLARWDALEAEHPRLFAGMIHVWCAR